MYYLNKRMSNPIAIWILQQTIWAVIVCSEEAIRSTIVRISLALQDTRLLPGTLSLSLIERTVTNRDFPPLFPFRNASQWMAQHFCWQAAAQHVLHVRVLRALTVRNSVLDRGKDYFTHTHGKSLGGVKWLWQLYCDVRAKVQFGHAKEQRYCNVSSMLLLSIASTLFMLGVSRERGIKRCRSRTKDSQKQHRNVPIKYNLWK
jgi:hypothetical protein